MEAKDSELLAALRKAAALTAELGHLRQQQLQQHDAAAAAAAGAFAGDASAVSSRDGGLRSSRVSLPTSAAGAAAVAGVFESLDLGSIAGGAGSGMPAAAHASQQLLTGPTASEPGACGWLRGCVGVWRTRKPVHACKTGLLQRSRDARLCMHGSFRAWLPACLPGPLSPHQQTFWRASLPCQPQSRRPPPTARLCLAAATTPTQRRSRPSNMAPPSPPSCSGTAAAAAA
jgi:hypothetical protein